MKGSLTQKASARLADVSTETSPTLPISESQAIGVDRRWAGGKQTPQLLLFRLQISRPHLIFFFSFFFNDSGLGWKCCRSTSYQILLERFSVELHLKAQKSTKKKRSNQAVNLQGHVGLRDSKVVVHVYQFGTDKVMTALNSQGWAHCTQEELTRCQQERIFGLQDYNSVDDLEKKFYMIGDKNA